MIALMRTISTAPYHVFAQWFPKEACCGILHVKVVRGANRELSVADMGVDRDKLSNGDPRNEILSGSHSHE